MNMTAVLKLMSENMTPEGFKAFCQIQDVIPDIWEKPTSSTGKYHKTKDGRVPSQAEHVYHMLYSCSKLFRMFGIEKKTRGADMMMIAIGLHDAFKYGMEGTNPYTHKKHDQLMADSIAAGIDVLKEVFGPNQIETIEEMIRFHSGRWSSDVVDQKKFNWTTSGLNFGTFFVHVLDMMSTADLIQTDIRTLTC